MGSSRMTTFCDDSQIIGCGDLFQTHTTLNAAPEDFSCGESELTDTTSLAKNENQNAHRGSGTQNPFLQCEDDGTYDDHARCAYDKEGDMEKARGNDKIQKPEQNGAKGNDNHSKEDNDDVNIHWRDGRNSKGFNGSFILSVNTAVSHTIDENNGHNALNDNEPTERPMLDRWAAESDHNAMSWNESFYGIG